MANLFEEIIDNFFPIVQGFKFQDNIGNTNNNEEIINSKNQMKIGFLPDSTEIGNIANSINPYEEQDKEQGLAELATFLNATPEAKIDLKGYYADLPSNLTGSDLALERANTIKQNLINHGIDESRITTSTGDNGGVSSPDMNGRFVQPTITLEKEPFEWNPTNYFTDFISQLLGNFAKQNGPNSPFVTNRIKNDRIIEKMHGEK